MGSRDLDINDVRDGFMVAGLAKTFELMKRDPDFLARMADRVSLVIIDEARRQSLRLIVWSSKFYAIEMKRQNC